MGFSFIREDDTTSHGGRVLKCSPRNESDGKAIALLGDMVSCPRCQGIFPIVQVKQLNITFDGRPVATEGDQTACGATLIASQNGTSASPTHGAGRSVGAGRTVISQLAEEATAGSQRGRFQILDDETGRPIPNHPYTVRSGNGQTIKGKTDENGYTDWLRTDSASSLTFDYDGAAPA